MKLERGYGRTAGIGAEESDADDAAQSQKTVSANSEQGIVLKLAGACA